VAIAVGNAIKNRASNEEILTVLKEVPNPNQEDDDGQLAPKHTHLPCSYWDMFYSFSFTPPLSVSR
jgi:hypothetical protein